MIKRLVASAAILTAVVIGLLGIVSTASAHPHKVTKGNGETVTLANGQNHPGFVYHEDTDQWVSCEGINEPADSGPAGYGLETAHHGPDQGTPGKADGCFALDAANGSPTDPRQDRNPAID